MYTNYFATTYGSGAYDAATYQGTGSSSGSSSGSSAGGSTGVGVLTDTGIALTAVVTLACLIALAAIVVKVWKRPAKLAAEKADS